MKDTGNRKLRSNSGWRQFTEPEQDKIREVFERDGEMAAAEYCRKIGKPWSHSSIGRLFAKERASRRAEDAEIRKDAARLKAVTAVYAKAGMGITEATAFNLTAKLRDAVKISAANPKTATGRAIITKAAPHLIALRALELREQIEAKRLEVRHEALKLGWAKYRFDAVETMCKNYDKVRQIMAGSGSSDEKTEALGKLIFGDEWDDEPSAEDGEEGAEGGGIGDAVMGEGAKGPDGGTAAGAGTKQ